MNRRPATLVLADGTRFVGSSVGASGVTVGEVVFTTGMTGYQEVLTDPSYCGQIVTMTATQMGNTGTTPEDDETDAPFVAGFVVHELSAIASNWRSAEPLDAYLAKRGIVALSGVDTRALTRHIRDQGAQMAAMGTEDAATLHDRAVAAPGMTGRDLTKEVTVAAPSPWAEGHGVWRYPASAATGDGNRHVVCVDFGVKRGILRSLVDAGCRVTRVPATTSADDVLALDPDGIFLSNGPGDPAAVTHGIETVRSLLGKKPMFGICLGHQILGLALGGSSYKLKFGHRGLNQPVQDLATGRVEITTQNHGFVVDVESLDGKARASHVNLNDGTNEGLVHEETGAFGVQYHPEASAGPHDARYLFDRFVTRIDDERARG